MTFEKRYIVDHEKARYAVKGAVKSLRKAPWGVKTIGRALSYMLRDADNLDEVCAVLPLIIKFVDWLEKRKWTGPAFDKWLVRVRNALDLVLEVVCQEQPTLPSVS